MEEGLINSAGGKDKCISKRRERGILDILDLCLGNGEQCGVPRDEARDTVKNAKHSITICPSSPTTVPVYGCCPGVLFS